MRAGRATPQRRSGFLWPRDSAGVGQLYVGLAMLMGLVGGGLAVLIRTQLSSSQAGGLLKPETYLSVVTMHGSLMVFGMAIPALFAGLGSIFLPRQLGRERLAWHGLHVGSFWLTLSSQLVLLACFATDAGAPGAGWSSQPPLSALEPMAWDGQDLWLLGMALACTGLLALAACFLRTRAAAPARGGLLLAAYRWAAASAWVGLPLMLIGLGLLASDRHLGTSHFMPTGMVLNDGVLPFAEGLPFLYRSLFWQLGHPSMLLLVLPALGVAFGVLEAELGAPLFARRSSQLALGALALSTWGLFAAQVLEAWQLPYPSLGNSLAALLPLGCLLLLTLNLGANLGRVEERLSLALCFVLALVVTLACAVLGGLWLCAQSSAARLEGSYFPVGQLHLWLGLVSLMAIFAGLHHGFGERFGRRMDEDLGRLHFWVSFLSLLSIFLLMHFQGLSGLLRRYWDHSHLGFAQAGQELAPWISGLTYLGAGAQAIFLFNFFSSVWLGTPAQQPSTEQPQPGKRGVGG